MNNKGSFAGKVALVTGASSGIGRELAVQLAAQSAQVVLVGRDVERLAAAQKACAAVGTTPHIVVADVSDEQGCRHAVAEAITTYGKLDALFCLAGQAMKGRFRDADNAHATVRLMGANFHSVVYLCHQALPHLARSSGHVVVAAGLVGHVAVPGYSAYAAAKHAVVGFCRSLRRELASEGVAVTLVSPDTVRTSVRDSMRDASGHPAPEAYGNEKTMSAVECARRILEATERRQPELVLGRGALLQMLQSLAPRLLDRMLGKSTLAHTSGAAIKGN